MSKDTRFKKGHTAWNKGIPISEKARKKLSESHRGKKLSVEHKAKLSVAHKGKKPSVETRKKMSDSHKGKERSVEHRKRLSEARKGKPCPWLKKSRPKKWVENASKAHRGYKFTKEQKERLSKAHKGQKAWNKGRGNLTEDRIARNLSSYNEWRLKVFERDSFSCRWCGTSGVYLNAHHIVKFSSNKELREILSNGITLCVPCHTKTLGKEKQFEEFFKKILGVI